MKKGLYYRIFLLSSTKKCSHRDLHSLSLKFSKFSTAFQLTLLQLLHSTQKWRDNAYFCRFSLVSKWFTSTICSYNLWTHLVPYVMARKCVIFSLLLWTCHHTFLHDDYRICMNPWNLMKKWDSRCHSIYKAVHISLRVVAQSTGTEIDRVRSNKGLKGWSVVNVVAVERRQWRGVSYRLLFHFWLYLHSYTFSHIRIDSLVFIYISSSSSTKCLIRG